MWLAVVVGELWGTKSDESFLDQAALKFAGSLAIVEDPSDVGHSCPNTHTQAVGDISSVRKSRVPLQLQYLEGTEDHPFHLVYLVIVPRSTLFSSPISSSSGNNLRFVQ